MSATVVLHSVPRSWPRTPVIPNVRAIHRGVIDSWLLLAVVLLLLVGEVMVFSTSFFYGFERFGDPYRFFWKHQVAIVLGGASLTIATLFPSWIYQRAAYPLLVLAILSLVAVFVPGVSHGRIHRWIHLGSMNFQPSELAKGAIVLYLATTLAKKSEYITDFFHGVLPQLIVTGTVILLIVLEPDLGGAVSVGLSLFALLFVAGARMWHLGAMAFCGLLLFLCAAMTASYRFDRIAAFLDTDAHKHGHSYQLNQSLLAFGAGGVHGVGLGESRQKMFYLPEAHTDFIFAVVGEETGLWGTGVIVGLFAVLAWRGTRIALRHPCPFGRLLAFGCMFLLVCQAGLNMAVVLGLLPTKGLPLPFISYGGSALVMSSIYAGVLLSLSRESVRENQVHA
ncbi:MAG: putative lipid II flippase FtsW [Deltaproteobacteria bacterium]|nr:putative lipid II flippase FtsW [Deltaproteobacteria bacterium]